MWIASLRSDAARVVILVGAVTLFVVGAAIVAGELSPAMHEAPWFDRR